MKKDRMDLASFASKQKELDNALVEVESRVKKVYGRAHCPNSCSHSFGKR